MFVLYSAPACSCCFLLMPCFPLASVFGQIKGWSKRSKIPTVQIDEIQDQIYNMKGCSASKNNRQCIYTKELHKDQRIEKNNSKTAQMGTLSVYSAIKRCALFVLGPIGAEVAWHETLTSLPCHMGTSYLARQTRHSTQELSKRGAQASQAADH